MESNASSNSTVGLQPTVNQEFHISIQNLHGIGNKIVSLISWVNSFWYDCHDTGRGENTPDALC
eukprot:1328122-Ditylum_brightwellii.AAC.1